MFLETKQQALFTIESTLLVSQVYGTRSYIMGYNRENAIMTIIECNEDNRVLLCKVTIGGSGPEQATWGEMM
jgi:hypothetical protein